MICAAWLYVNTRSCVTVLKAAPRHGLGLKMCLKAVDWTSATVTGREGLDAT